MGTNNRFENFFRTLIWIGVFSLIITLLVSAHQRVNTLIELNKAGIIPPPSSIDHGYILHPQLTYVHIFPGVLFLLLGAVQFMKPVRNRFIAFHRWCGRIYLVFACITGVTAVLMGFIIRYGGFVETAATTVFGVWFLYALARAYFYILKKNFLLHREWMIRAFAIGLAVATMRPIIGLFFAFTSIPFQDFFGAVFWMAFVLHFAVAELWIRYTRTKDHVPA